MKVKIYVKLIFLFFFCSLTSAEQIDSSDFDFLLKKIVYLEHEAKIIKEHLAFRGSLNEVTKNAPPSAVKIEEIREIKDRLIKIEHEIKSGKFSLSQTKKLEKKLADSQIAKLVLKIDSLKAEWQRDDELVINKATDRAYQEMVSYYMFAVAVITLLSTAIFFVLESRNKKIVDKKIASETAIQYEQMFDTWLEQKNNAREDSYRTSLIYANLALNIYLTRFLIIQSPEEYGEYADKTDINRSEKFDPMLLIEAINLLKHSEQILKTYQAAHNLELEIPRAFLNKKGYGERKRRSIRKKLEQEDMKLLCLKSEVYLDWAYYLGEFQRKMTLNDETLRTMKEYVLQFLSNKPSWLKNEHKRNSANFPRLLERIASINDTILVIQIQTGLININSVIEIQEIIKKTTFDDLLFLSIGNTKGIEKIFNDIFQANSEKHSLIL